MSIPIEVGGTVQVPFSVFEEDGVTPLVGLTDGDFQKLLLLGGVEKANPVTVTEVPTEPGAYWAEFVPDEKGTWWLRLTLAAEEQVLGCYVTAGQFFPAVTAKSTLCP